MDNFSGIWWDHDHSHESVMQSIHQETPFRVKGFNTFELIAPLGKLREIADGTFGWNFVTENWLISTFGSFKYGPWANIDIGLENGLTPNMRHTAVTTQSVTHVCGTGEL